MTAKSYLLLTGASGLLGRVLMRDLLRKGHRLAVLVRGSSSGDAARRIQRILRARELVGHYSLPEPVVIQGSLDATASGLSVSTTDAAWIAKHVREVVHCAASISFEYAQHSNEPFRTNVDGTRALIDFCVQSGISSFHHVSTAYICGDAAGPIRETDTDQGQTPRNVYERSKLQAELLIADARHHFDKVTIYRPSIIVGEYSTGFTSTFHGFYLPLKLLSSLPQALTDSIHPSYFWKSLGMSGADCKNLVPVDWVSLAMARIISDPKLQGRTYHLTHWEPTPVERIGKAFAAALGSLSAPIQHQASEDVFALFADKMSLYQNYWGRDPVFDQTHLNAALSSLRAPQMTQATLLRLTRFAMAHRFFWTD